MRASYTIDANAADPFQQVGLTWDAVTCMVYNPTKFTALLRLGTSRPASTADAYLPVGPAEAICLPVSGRDFVVVLSTPTLPLAPVGMPTVCSVTLYDATEKPPAFGSIALTGQPTPADVLLLNHATTGTSPATNTVPLPASLRAVSFYQGNPTSLTRARIVGHDSGIVYMDVTLSLLTSGNHETCDVFPALDTSIDVTVTGTANPYILLGHAVPKDSGIYSSEGVPRVILWADPGNAASQAQLVNYDGTIVRPSLPLPVLPLLPAPSADVSGVVASPAANTLVVATPALAAGDYYVEADLFSNDTAGFGHYIFLQNAAATRQSIAPPPCSFRVQWSRVTLAAAVILEVRTGGVATAAALYGGTIRAHKIA